MTCPTTNVVNQTHAPLEQEVEVVGPKAKRLLPVSDLTFPCGWCGCGGIVVASERTHDKHNPFIHTHQNKTKKKTTNPVNKKTIH